MKKLLEKFWNLFLFVMVWGSLDERLGNLGGFLFELSRLEEDNFLSNFKYLKFLRNSSKLYSIIKVRVKVEKSEILT
jgi:hypothetical protein